MMAPGRGERQIDLRRGSPASSDAESSSSRLAAGISASQKWLLILFNGSYIAGSGIWFVVDRNYEFVWYVVVVALFFALVLLTIGRSRFPPYVLWCLSIWGLLHMAGGGIRIGDHVLYAQHLIPMAGEGESFVLKYDQAVHAFGFMTATFVTYHLLRPQLSMTPNRAVVYAIAAAAGMGLGALNEIVEFMPVSLGFETGVGGYFNTALDLVFNGIGAVIAVTLIHLAGKFSSRDAREGIPPA